MSIPTTFAGSRGQAARAHAARVYAVLAYATFLAVTLWGVLFLADLGPAVTVDSRRSGPAWSTVAIDVGLWLVFALQHSVTARAPVKTWLTRVVPQQVERSTYVLTGSLALGLVFWQWRALPHPVWQLHAQPWTALIWTGYGVGWAIAIAATYMINHWEFSGLRPTTPPSPDAPVSERWLYAWVRHPMMLGLLIAFWATPEMTVGHLLFALSATAYIAVGVHFEERDLRRNLGRAYDEYARRVPRFVPRFGSRSGPA